MKSGACGNWTFAAAILAAVMLVAGPAMAEPRALLIGIGPYPKVTPLRGPERDVARMKAFATATLGFRPEQVRELRDAAATHQGIVNAIREWLVAGSQPGDKVLLYYSGHGAQIDDLDGDEEDGLDETLVPFDTGVGGDITANQLSDDQLAELLAPLADRKLTMIIDACHSGTITRNLRPTDAPADDARPRTIFPTTVTRSGAYDVAANRAEQALVAEHEGWTIWTAASSFQYSWESNGEGLFTKYFVEGSEALKADRNRNKIVTAAELLDYARLNAGKWCEGNPTCRTVGFTPTLEAAAGAMAQAIVPVGGVGVVGDLFGGAGDGATRIEILPHDAMKIGEKVRFRVTSERDGRLVLLDVNAKGEVTQLFPNFQSTRHERGDKIARGRPITVPDAYYGFDFTASEPRGEGTVLAIVLEDDLSLNDIVGGHLNLDPIADRDRYLAELAKRVREIWSKDERNRELRWSLAVATYRIDG